ncbi:PaaI family thioesterase [Aspergillus undulatus]|uniref:PaaI family thioesterase n=1 Tax=Aspergillus undulatus TaxID=1810928 RepID=UPI003CCCCEDB
MASIPRSISRLLRRQTPALSPALRVPISVPVRTAQTQAAPAALNNTPPPSLQSQPQPQPGHHGRHSHAHQKPPSSATQTQTSKQSDPIASHPLLARLRSDPTLRETRPHLSMPSHLQPSHLVAGTLSRENGLTSAPYMFLSRPSTYNQSQNDTTSTTPHKSTSTTLFHTGTHLTGHPGYIHGGFLSIMFDEVFAHTVSQAFRSGTGMTANLNVDFRKPALPNRVFVLETETTSVEGRKAWVEGKMRMLPAEGASGQEGIVVAEARALFVEPKFAESMVPVYRS